MQGGTFIAYCGIRLIHTAFKEVTMKGLAMLTVLTMSGISEATI